MKVVMRSFFGIAALMLLMILSVPFESMGQGRGRRVSSGLGKKCAKFVNCHDARDGRWDGRGPNRRVVFTDRLYRQRRVRRDRDYDVLRSRRNQRRDRNHDVIWRRRH